MGQNYTIHQKSDDISNIGEDLKEENKTEETNAKPRVFFVLGMYKFKYLNC